VHAFTVSVKLLMISYDWTSVKQDWAHSKTRNKSNDYFESLQYRHDLFAITCYCKRKHFPSYTRCTENHNNTCAENRKIHGL